MTKPLVVILLEQDDFDLGNPRDEYESIGTLYTWHNRYTLGGKNDFNNQNKLYNLLFWVYEEFQLCHLPELQNFNLVDDTIYVIGDEGEEIEAGYHTSVLFQDTIKEWMKENVCILPVYMYDHSGITISTKPFSCHWDSGQVGFIYVAKETCERVGVNFNDAKKILEDEISLLDQYLTGDVWYARTCLCDESILDDENEDLYLHYEDETIQIYTSSSAPEDEYILEEDSCGGIYGHDEALGLAVDMARGWLNITKNLIKIKSLVKADPN